MNTVKCEKPEFTEEMRAKLNKMYKLLKERFYSKQELMEIFGLGERNIRQMVTHISHRFPVISTSGTNAGYKIATSDADLELVEHSWKELSSRVEEIEKRIEPLIKFRDKIRTNL
jgi:biotin operon repressor